MPLYPEHFRGFIQRNGESVRWFKALPCSCYNPKSGSYDRNCTVGHSKNGRIYEEQTVPSGVKAIIYSEEENVGDAEGKRLKIVTGRTMMLCMPDELPVARLDKIMLIERRPLVRVVIQRSADVSVLTDILVDLPIVDVSRVFQDDTDYTVDVDYEVNNDNTGITWLDGIYASSPAPGTNYSVEHTYIPTYWSLNTEGDRDPRPQFEGVLGPDKIPLTRKEA